MQENKFVLLVPQTYIYFDKQILLLITCKANYRFACLQKALLSEVSKASGLSKT